MPAKQPFVSIILLNYNGKEDTLNCLKSLESLNYKSFEVIIIDNDSHDDSISALKAFLNKSHLTTKLLPQSQNWGFAEGNNIGVRNAKGDIVVLLNNDTIVDKNWLKELVNGFTDSSIVIVGSRIKNVGDFYGKKETLGSLLSLTGEPIEANFSDKSFTGHVSGCCFAFRKKIIPLPFDKSYFIYFEDAAASTEALLKGFKIKIAPKAKLTHVGGQVVKTMPHLAFHAEKNRLMNILVYYEFSTLIKLMPIFLINILFTFLVATVKLRLLKTLAAHAWVILNIHHVMKLRRKVQKARKLPDSELFAYRSYKFPYKVFIISGFINTFNLFYCRLLRIPVYELRQPKS